MPRRATIVPRQIDPDPRYQNMLLAKFINNIMHGGKKSTAQRMVYKGLENQNQEKRLLSLLLQVPWELLWDKWQKY